MANLIGAWQFWALTAAVFAALTAIFSKVGVQDIGGDLAAFIRTVIILPLLAIFLYATGQFKNPEGVTSRSMLFLALSALATGISWLAYFRALKLGDVTKVAPLDKLSVVFVAIIGVTMLGEKVSPANWFGVLFMVVGALLLGMV
ncbi:MAG: EamA family transporter [Chloroflexota bacterium]